MEYLGEASPPALSDPATLLKRADAAALKKAPEARALFGEAVKAAVTSKDPEVSNNWRCQQRPCNVILIFLAWWSGYSASCHETC